ncbi:hypothetical protein D3C81_313650 [compost metagenome]
MPAPSSFHRHSDGRGPRRVFVNGVEVERAIWCDTAAGVCVYAPLPIKPKRPAREEIYTRRLRGAVTVVPA